MNVVCLAVGHRWRLRHIGWSQFAVCTRCGRGTVTPYGVSHPAAWRRALTWLADNLASLALGERWA